MIAKTKSTTRTSEQTQTGIDHISKTSIYVMGGVSALVGLWAVACFIGVMVSSGGPLAAIKGWFSAVTGM